MTETNQAEREASGARPYGRYLEDFEVGAVYKHWPAKTVTEADNHLFCLLTMNHHPLHINDVYAAESQQGRNVVVGPLVYSLALGMSVADVSGKAIANLATEELSHPAPVFHGDTLFAESEVLDRAPIGVEAGPRRGQGPHARLQAGRHARRRVQARGAGAAAHRRGLNLHPGSQRTFDGLGEHCGIGVQAEPVHSAEGGRHEAEADPFAPAGGDERVDRSELMLSIDGTRKPERPESGNDARARRTRGRLRVGDQDDIQAYGNRLLEPVRRPLDRARSVRHGDDSSRTRPLGGHRPAEVRAC